MKHTLEQYINKEWSNLNSLSTSLDKNVELRAAVQSILNQLDSGLIRVAEKINSIWTVNEWVKKAILMSFKLIPNQLYGSQHTKYYDKFPSKFNSWSESDFSKAQIRVLPGGFVRHGAFVGPNSILMPSFVNLGAYIGSGTMIDSWATVGSCAQIGKNCHISGGVGIGGVLEPPNAAPVIIEDNCFIGARSEIAEGVIIEEGCVISMGVYIGASTKIFNRETGELTYGRVHANSVVVPGTLPGKNDTNLYAAIIVKQVTKETRSKVSLNELLRETAEVETTPQPY